MSIYVIANCNLEIEAVSLTTEQQESLKKIIVETGGCAVHVYNDAADWSLSGNHGVDYSVMDKIKKFLKKIKIKTFRLISNEYSETGDGYNFDTEDK